MGGHAVQQWGVMQGAVPGRLKLEKHPETHTHTHIFFFEKPQSIIVWKQVGKRLRVITMHCVCVPQCTVYVYLSALCMCTSVHCVCVPQCTVYVYLNTMCMCTSIHYVPQYTMFVYLYALCICTSMHCACVPQSNSLGAPPVIIGALQEAGREEIE